MADKLFGHDGRGHYKGVSLVEVPGGIEKLFPDILTVESEIGSNKIKDSSALGREILKSDMPADVLSHLGITDEMLKPGKDGAQGPIGPEGPQGIQGPKGDTGSAGLQGPQGPKGDEGIQGIQGQTGPEGPQGPIGLQGQPGKDGAQGPAGQDGVDGAQGPVGPIGPAGLTWRGSYDNSTAYVKDDAVAYQGATYFSLKPTTGVAPLPENDGWALMAAHGLRGEPGPEGPAGSDGVSNVPGPKGDKGDPGPQGSQGPAGQDGQPGPRGPAGQDGAQGQQGIQGVQGQSGSQGPTGLPGRDGIDGKQGPQGPKGDQGIQGSKGDKGDNALFDVDKLTQDDLAKLYGKLRPFYPQRYWLTKTYFQRPTNTTQGTEVRIGDTNLKMIFIPYAVDFFRIEIGRFASDRNSTYDIRKIGFYDAGGIDCSRWDDTNFTGTSVVFDAVMYNESRELSEVSIHERSTGNWWKIDMTIIGSLRTNNPSGAAILMEVEKLTNETKLPMA